MKELGKLFKDYGLNTDYYALNQQADTINR